MPPDVLGVVVAGDVVLGDVVPGDVADGDDVPECAADEVAALEAADPDGADCFAVEVDEQAAVNQAGAVSTEAAVAALRRKLRREADCVGSSEP